MNTQFLISKWSASSWTVRLCLLGALLVVILIATGVVDGLWERHKQHAFDRRATEKQAQIDKLDSQINDLKQRAAQAEAKAGMAEQKAETLEALNRQQGQIAAAAARKVEDAFAAYQQDENITGASVSNEIRQQRICEKRKELGYPCGK